MILDIHSLYPLYGTNVCIISVPCIAKYYTLRMINNKRKRQNNYPIIYHIENQ